MHPISFASRLFGRGGRGGRWSLAALALLTSGASHANLAHLPEFAPCSPVSDEPVEMRDGQGKVIPGTEGLRKDFCAEWNPEFPFNGFRCCSRVMRAKVRRRRGPPKVCPRDRFKPNFCDEATAEQRSYEERVASGKVPDILALIDQEMGRRGSQAYCTVNNGFLAWGRPVLPTPANRIQLRAADRCTHYGTDHMTGMIEWVGRQLHAEYSDERSGARLTVGDISAPRGGCLAGRNGPRGHASHTTGQDADIGFLSVRAGRTSPNEFITDFDAKSNWWLLKQFFKNPYACVKVVFLDKRNIRKIERVARGDEDWTRYRRFVRHSPGHRNHFHVRVGDGPGLPGCFPGADPENETEEAEGIEEIVDLDKLDEIPGQTPIRSSASSPAR